MPLLPSLRPRALEKPTLRFSLNLVPYASDSFPQVVNVGDGFIDTGGSVVHAEAVCLPWIMN